MVVGIRDYNSPFGERETYNYDVYFFSDTISTIVTINSTTVSRWISSVNRSGQQRLIVGLDTEWGHAPTRGGYQPVRTLQLCVGSRCLIYQIFHSPSVPESLGRFLSDSNCDFVGVNVKQDLEKLQNEYGIGGGACYLDLRDLAAEVYGRKELKNSGLKSLAGLVLGKEMEKQKELTVSRWGKRYLAAEQVRYACLDAFVSMEIGRVLIAASQSHR